MLLITKLNSPVISREFFCSDKFWNVLEIDFIDLVDEKRRVFCCYIIFSRIMNTAQQHQHLLNNSRLLFSFLMHVVFFAANMVQTSCLDFWIFEEYEISFFWNLFRRGVSLYVNWATNDLILEFYIHRSH